MASVQDGPAGDNSPSSSLHAAVVDCLKRDMKDAGSTMSSAPARCGSRCSWWELLRTCAAEAPTPRAAALNRDRQVSANSGHCGFDYVICTPMRKVSSLVPDQWGRFPRSAGVGLRLRRDVIGELVGGWSCALPRQRGLSGGPVWCANRSLHISCKLYRVWVGCN